MVLNCYTLSMHNTGFLFERGKVYSFYTCNRQSAIKKYSFPSQSSNHRRQTKKIKLLTRLTAQDEKSQAVIDLRTRDYK
jgi:hypothetical protein